MGKYEEALERARAGKPIDEVFPELKESEDERIRKGLVHYILYEAGNLLDEETEHKFIGWLERQKEQKPTNDSIRGKIISRATSEKQIVLISESSGKAEIGWDTRSLEDAKKLLEYGLAFINKNGVKPAESSDDVIKVASIVYKFVRKVLDYFGVYSEEEELIDSREEILCYFSQDCAEEIIEFLRPDSYKNCNSRWKPSEEQPEGGCSEKPNDLLLEQEANLEKKS